MENPTLWAFRIPRLWYLQHQLEMRQHQQETVRFLKDGDAYNR